MKIILFIMFFLLPSLSLAANTEEAFKCYESCVARGGAGLIFALPAVLIRKPRPRTESIAFQGLSLTPLRPRLSLPANPPTRFWHMASL